MKKLLFTILLSFVAILAYSQVNYSFRGKANIYSATRGTGIDTSEWNLLAVFQDDMGFYASDSLEIGDYIYTTSDFGCAALRVDTINSKTGGVFNLDVTDMNNVLTSISGQSFVFTPTPNNALPTFAQGLPAQIQACIIADLALRVDDALSNVTPDSTIFQTVYRGDTSAQAIRQEIADSNATYPTIGTLLQNKFPFASGTKSLTTSLSYLGRETGRVYVDSLAAFRLPSWLTAGRIASPKNGDMAYNTTLHLPDIRINSAWKNLTIQNGALTSTYVPFVNSDGHLTNKNTLVFDSVTDILKVGLNASAGTGQGMVSIFQRADSFGAGLTFSVAGSTKAGLRSNAAGDLIIEPIGGGTSSFYASRAAINALASTASTGSQFYVLTGGTSNGPTQGVRISGSFIRATAPVSGTDGSRKTLILIDPTYNLTSLANEDLRGIDYNPTATSILGNHYGLTIGSGLSGFGTRTPTQTVDVNGAIRLRGLVYDGTNSSGVDGQLFSKTSTGTAWINAPETGSASKNIHQTAHGFNAPEAVFWNGVEYETADGVVGDTIRCTGVVVQVYSVDSFKLQFNGIYEDDFSLPEGLYYVNTTGGLSLTQDPDVLIPAMQVENGYSIINPIVEDEVQALAGEAFTLETLAGSRGFDIGETLTMHYDSLIGQSYAALYVPEDTIVMTGSNYYTVGSWNTAELATSDWTKRDTALVYTGTNGVVFKVSADVCYRVWPDNIATDKTYELRLMTGSGASTMSRRYKDVPDDGHTDCVTMTAFYTGNNGGTNALIRVSVGAMPGEIKFIGGSLVVERL